MSQRRKIKEVPTLKIPEKKEREPSKRNFVLRAKTEGQQYYIDTIKECIVTICTGPAGSGKALTMDSKIYTPNGYILNKDIKVGDEVCTPNGGRALVDGVYPQGVKKIYKITFSDGATIECSEDHLWEIDNSNNKWGQKRVVDTKYLLENYLHKSGRRNLWIKTTQPVDFDEQDFVIDPYIMGILIAEGCILRSVEFSAAEEFISEKVKNILNRDNPELKLSSDSGKRKDHSISRKNRGPGSNAYLDELRKLGIFGHYSYEKFIPEKYLYSSKEQRLSLLRGLMDGDGTVSKKAGMPIYYTTSERLKNDFVSLVNSLGGLCSVSTKIPKFIYNGIEKEGKLCYIIHINIPNGTNCFSLDRKVVMQKDRTKYLLRRFIEKVEYVGDKECQCISIDDKEHLYLTDNYIVTHNTHLAIGKGMEMLKNGEVEQFVLFRPMQECGRSIGFLPGDKDEKLAPHVQVFHEFFDKMMTQTEYNNFVKLGKIRLEIIEFCRGMTFDDSFIFVDEAQNCTYQQLVMLLTRVGKNSKIVLSGDVGQTDLWDKFTVGNKNPFEAVMDRLDNKHDDIGIVELDENDIVRSGICAVICKHLGV